MRKNILFIVMLFAYMGCAFAVNPALTISSLNAPLPVQVTHQQLLVYELHFYNAGPIPLRIKHIEIRDDENNLLKSLNESQINANSNLFVNGKHVANGVFELAQHTDAFAYIYLKFDKRKSLPANLEHRIWVVSTNADKSRSHVNLAYFDLAVSKDRIPVLSSPLKGHHWIAEAAISPTSYHRRAILPLDGNYYLAQRYAIDWVHIKSDGKEVHGNMHDNHHWSAFGYEVLAVDDGLVTEVHDTIKQNNTPPGLPDPQPNISDLAGNHVILKIHQYGKDYYVLYAHMQPNSIRVSVGDKIKKGQVIGLLGNTGNSSQPHLHMQVSTNNDPLKSDGVPFIFAKTVLEGHATEIDMDYGQWQPFSPSKDDGPVYRILPAENQVFDFNHDKNS